MKIRLLDGFDAQIYKEVRLRALKNDAGAFGSTYDQEATRPLESFVKRIQYTKSQFTLGCFDDSNTLVGIVNFVRESMPKTSHKGNVYGMYVERELRGRGFGKDLMLALIERATKEYEGLEQIHLTVVSNNESAKRFYVSLGFEIYGVEPHALKLNGHYFDEDLLVLRLPTSD